MEIQKTIRVILADDHPVIRRGIRRMLEKNSDICVVGEADTGAAPIALVHECKADVLLLDIEMPDIEWAPCGQGVTQTWFSHIDSGPERL